MAECPSKECQKNMQGMKKSLYGEDGTAGVVGCMKKMVTKKAAWTGFLLIGIPLLITGVKVWSGQNADPLKYAKKEDVIELQIRASLIEERYAHISEALKRLEKKLDETKKDLLKEIERLKP